MPIYLGNQEIGAQYVDAYQLGKAYLGSDLVLGNETFISASGGTITTSGNYRIHTFTTVGTSSFNILATGSIPTNNTIEYLVVAGGGGGNLIHIYNGQNQNFGIGGGAGGVQTGSLLITSSGVNNIIVGNGGLGTDASIDQDAPGLNGSSSFALGITANFGYGATNGFDSTGGQSGNGFGKGFNNQLFSAPGGGGASEVGYPSENPGGGLPNGGNGGNGIASSISGVSTYYGGGGGGNPPNNGKGLGGLGGGGNSGSPGGNGTANTGGGGGGSARGIGQKAGNGGSGVVILRYPFQ
jgi:hypothetical protein